MNILICDPCYERDQSIVEAVDEAPEFTFILSHRRIKSRGYCQSCLDQIFPQTASAKQKQGRPSRVTEALSEGSTETNGNGKKRQSRVDDDEHWRSNLPMVEKRTKEQLTKQELLKIITSHEYTQARRAGLIYPIARERREVGQHLILFSREAIQKVRADVDARKAAEQ